MGFRLDSLYSISDAASFSPTPGDIVDSLGIKSLLS